MSLAYAAVLSLSNVKAMALRDPSACHPDRGIGMTNGVGVAGDTVSGGPGVSVGVAVPVRTGAMDGFGVLV
jgi:hypothetical protein